jgi:hypothetical protein
MAFKRTATINVSVGISTVLTVPAGKVYTLIDCSCANVEPSGFQVLGTVRHIQGGVTAHLIKNGPIPAGSAMVVVGAPRKVVMETGDQLTALCDKANGFDITVSYLEQDA